MARTAARVSSPMGLSLSSACFYLGVRAVYREFCLGAQLPLSLNASRVDLLGPSTLTSQSSLAKLSGVHCTIAERSLREGRMNIAETYDYLVRARRNLWAGLKAVPGEVFIPPVAERRQVSLHQGPRVSRSRHGGLLDSRGNPARTAGVADHSCVEGYPGRPCFCRFRSRNAAGLLAACGAEHPRLPPHSR